MAREKRRSDAVAGSPPGVDSASTKDKAFVTPGRVLVVTSVMLTFISAWRVAAIVLCDLAGTAYYIGGIVESQIGKAAPWFILAVMLFSYAVRSVYIESCSMSRPRRRLSGRERGDGRVARQDIGLGPPV